MCERNIQNETEAVKCCTKCGEEKPLSEFHRDKSKAGGRRNDCKVCACLQKRKYSKENNDHVRALKRANNRKHRDRIKKHDAEYYAANREEILRKKKEYHARPEIKQQYKEYQKRTGASKKWHERNPERRRASWVKRRATEREAKGEFTAEELRLRFDYHGNKCIYCGCTENLTVEHMIPLNKGGTNWPANLAPACGSCNSGKRDSSFWEFSGKKRPRG